MISMRCASRVPSAGVLALGVLLAGCEQPVRPGNPSPLQAAADHLNVPVAVLSELQRTSAHIQPPQGTGGPRTATTGAQAEQLRRTMQSLEQIYTNDPAAP